MCTNIRLWFTCLIVFLLLLLFIALYAPPLKILPLINITKFLVLNKVSPSITDEAPWAGPVPIPVPIPIPVPSIPEGILLFTCMRYAVNNLAKLNIIKTPESFNNINVTVTRKV